MTVVAELNAVDGVCVNTSMATEQFNTVLPAHMLADVIRPSTAVTFMQSSTQA